MKAPIKEPLHVDLEVQNRELTAKEAESLRQFLQTNKARTPRSKARSARRAAVRRKLKAGK